MSDVLGFDEGVSYGNQVNQSFSNINRRIQDANLSNLRSYNTDKNRELATYNIVEGGLEKERQSQDQSTAKDDTGEFLNDVRNTYRGAKGFMEKAQELKGIVDTTTSQLSEVINPLASSVTHSGDVNAVVDFAGKTDWVSSFHPPPTKSIAEGTQVVEAVRVGEEASDVGSAGRVLSKAVTSTTDVIGKVGEVASVGEGVYDAYEDLTGHWKQMDALQKTSNVSTMVGGAFGDGSLASTLEGAGAILDSTGIGAEIGIALGVAGIVAGGVSAIADWMESDKKKPPVTAKPKTAPPPVPIPTSVQASVSQAGGIASRSYN